LTLLDKSKIQTPVKKEDLKSYYTRIERPISEPVLIQFCVFESDYDRVEMDLQLSQMPALFKFESNYDRVEMTESHQFHRAQQSAQYLNRYRFGSQHQKASPCFLRILDT
jgi:hypothetical protein